MTEPTSEKHRRLEEVQSAYLKAVEAGEEPDRAALLAAHPDLADELHEFFLNRERAAPPGSYPASFGDYDLLQELGRGGMGVVFKAQDRRVGRLVALKMLIGGRLASKEDRERFRIEVQATASLEHPLIVPVYEVGELGGQPFFTTKFMEGGSVDGHLEHYGRDPRAAASLVASVARSIHFAHRHGFLHRDLKPANILLDADRRPHLTDFGLALRVDADRRMTSAGIVIGTVNYMAPEQASGDAKLTTAVDIYALGAILYELLTGKVPFDGATPAETLRSVLDREVVPPRSHAPGVDRDLERICLKCLDKDPARRYGSAEALAEDLERWLQGKPVEARPMGAASRALRWCRRNPGFASLYASVALLALLLVGGAGVQLAREHGRRNERLEASADMASLVADRIRERFEEWGEVVWRKASDPELHRALEAWAAAATPEERERRIKDLEGLCRDFREGFQNWHLLDAKGAMIVRTVAPRNESDPAARPEQRILGHDFGNRDYFKGTRNHVGRQGRAAVHVSSVYTSIADRLDKYDIGAPIVTESGAFLGVIAVAVTTDRDMRLPPKLIGKWQLALVGPGDPSDSTGYRVVLHPGMGRKVRAVEIDHPSARELSQRDCERELDPADPAGPPRFDEDYRDPVYASWLGTSATPAEGWLAGFAPVGHTGFVVIVSQPK